MFLLLTIAAHLFPLNAQAGSCTPHQFKNEGDPVANQVAAGMHQRWRDNWIRANLGQKRLKDDGKGGTVDIAATPYSGLPRNFKVENLASAEVALELVRAQAAAKKPLDSAFIEQASDVIHQRWLTRNGCWAPPEQSLAYAALHDAEKEKDRVVVRMAIRHYQGSRKP